MLVQCWITVNIEPTLCQCIELPSKRNAAKSSNIGSMLADWCGCSKQEAFNDAVLMVA